MMNHVIIFLVIAILERGNASRNKTLSYESSYNETIECNKKNQKVIFHSPRAQAAIVFSQVRLQPYSKFVRLDNGKGRGLFYICYNFKLIKPCHLTPLLDIRPNGLKLVCSETETSFRVKISVIQHKVLYLPRQRNTKRSLACACVQRFCVADTLFNLRIKRFFSAFH